MVIVPEVAFGIGSECNRDGPGSIAMYLHTEWYGSIRDAFADGADQ
jgi:hypothetical protein